MSKKFLLASLAAFVANFLGGWLIYGLLLKDMMAANTPDAVKPLMIDPPNMMYLALGQIILSVMITWIIDRTGSHSVAKGIRTAVTVNVLISLGFGFMWSSMMNMYINPGTGMLIDLVATIVMGILTGAAAGWVLGRDAKTA